MSSIVMKPSPDLVTNGGFDTDTVWTKGLRWTISGGSASVIAGVGSNDITQEPIGPYINGHLYRTVFEVTSFSSSGNGVYIRFIGAGGGGLTGIVRAATGSYTQDITMTATNDQLKFRSLSNNECSIDNVSVKEVKTIAKPSTELVTNGGFDTDSGYTKDTGWTISGGKLRATSAGNSAAAFQGRLVEIGETVMVTFTVDSISEGAVKAFVGGSGNAGTARTTPGTYREIFVAGTPNTTGLVASGTTTCVIDNFSAKLVKALIK